MALLLALAGTALIAGLAAAPPARPAYAAGQVWEYRTRPGDEESRIRIQKIELYPGLGGDGLVYHVTIVGVELGAKAWAGIIQHAPVSKATLDSSLTRLSDSPADFPGADEGIAEWRRARGGVFTISVAEIVGLLAATVARGGPAPD